MKKRLQKMSMVVAAIVLFAGVMLLNVEKNDQGQWEVATVSSFAQGGEESGGYVKKYSINDPKDCKGSELAT